MLPFVEDGPEGGFRVRITGMRCLCQGAHVERSALVDSSSGSFCLLIYVVYSPVAFPPFVVRVHFTVVRDHACYVGVEVLGC